MMRFGIVAGLAAACLAAVAWAGVGAGAAQAAPDAFRPPPGAAAPVNGQAVITIGVGAALNAVPALGWRQANAAQLAVNQVNASGGITLAGTVYSLTLVVADDGCSPAQAEAAANALLSAGSVAVVGYTCSGATNAAQPIHAAAGVPSISASSTGPFVTDQGYTTTFRVITRDDNPPAMLAAHLRGWLGLERAAIVDRDGFWGNWASDRISTTFTSLGGTVTSRRSTSTGQFTATLSAVQAESPDVIFYSDVDAKNAGLLSQVAHGLGMTGTIVAWNSFSEDEAVLADYAAQAGAAAEGDYAVMFYRRAQDMPGYPALNAAYQAAGFANYGDEATAWAAFPYDAANILIDAMRRAQSADPRDIRDAVAGLLAYQGVVGAYRGFDAKGDVAPQWAWFERYASGGWVIARPGRAFVPIALRSQE